MWWGCTGLVETLGLTLITPGDAHNEEVKGCVRPLQKLVCLQRKLTGPSLGFVQSEKSKGTISCSLVQAMWWRALGDGEWRGTGLGPWAAWVTHPEASELRWRQPENTSCFPAFPFLPSFLSV